MISAHWESRIPTVSRAVQPETIHDFSGFPTELYKLQYPAPGAPEMAQAAATALQQAGITVQLDDTHGLDQGVLIIGSGSITHNLRALFQHPPGVPAPEWVTEFCDWVAERIAAVDLD